MTKDDLIRMADLAGYDVDEDDVHAPASGRFGIDPRLVHFAQMVADSMLIRQKAKYYQQGYEAGQRDAVLKPIKCDCISPERCELYDKCLKGEKNNG